MTEPRGPNPLGLPRQPEPVPGEGPAWSPGTDEPRMPLDIPNEPDQGSFDLPREVPDESGGSLDLPALAEPAL
jgi:hypothetical protein